MCQLADSNVCRDTKVLRRVIDWAGFSSGANEEYRVSGALTSVALGVRLGTRCKAQSDGLGDAPQTRAPNP